MRNDVLSLDTIAEAKDRLMRLSGSMPTSQSLDVLPVFTNDTLGHYELREEPSGFLRRLQFRFERLLRQADLIDPPWQALAWRRFVVDPTAYHVRGVGLVMHPEIAERLKRATQ